MKKPIAKFGIGTMAAVAFLTLVLTNSCNKKPPIDDGPLLHTSSTAWELAEAKAPSGGYRIYLDASGSMPGYFTDGLTDYITIVSALQDANPKSEVYCWGDLDHKIVDLNSSITKGFKGKSSLFQDIFKEMKDSVISGDVLTFLITDGVVSNCNAVTNQRTGYTQADLPLIPGKIKASLGGEKAGDIAVAVFRFMVPFNGKYYDIDNHNKLLEAERPLYVFAIGKKGAIVDFKNNALPKKEMAGFREKKPQQLYLGHLVKKENSNLLCESGDIAFQNDEEDSMSFMPDGIEEFCLAADIPAWIVADGIDPGNFKASLVNKDGVKKDGKVNTEFSKIDNILNISTVYSTSDMEAGEEPDDNARIDPDVYVLSYDIVYVPATEWNKYSCDDDRNIFDDVTLQIKTFGIAEIVKGFEQATQHPDTIFSTSFKFRKQ